MRIVSLCLLLLALTAGAGEPPEVTIGVLAKRGEQRALAKWGPTAAYLDERIPGHRFRVVPMEFDEIPSLVKRRMVDFVIVNPGIYVDLNVRFGVSRILTLKNRLAPGRHLTRFGSVIFARAGDGGEGLEWLRGRRLAAVHPTSLGGWRMALRELREAGVREQELQGVAFLGTHDAVAAGVLAGEYDAGVVRSDTLERMAAEGALELDRLRVIHPRRVPGFPFLLSSRLYPEWPFAKLEHTPSDLAKAVAIALMQLAPDHPAADAARIEGWTTPENYQPVHDLLRELELPPYQGLHRISLLDAIRTYWYWLLLIVAGFAVLLLQTGRIARLNRHLLRQQEALHESEERFRGTFEQAAVGIAHATPDGGFLRLNRRFAEITGYPEVELKRLNLNDLTHPDDLPQLLQRFERLRKGEIDHFSLQQRYRCKEGGEVWVLLTVSAIEEPGGGLKYLVAVVDEIGELKRLEREIAQQQRLREVVLDIAGDGILGLDREGRHTFVNPAAAALLGYEAAEMLGRDSHALWHHTRADGSPFPQRDCPITTVLEEGLVHRGRDELFWRRDGSAFRAEYISTPMIENGEVTGAVVVFRPLEEPASP